MKNQEYLKQFINKYPIQKTLRFKLIPQGKTQQWIDERGLIAVDKERNENMNRLKDIADDYHREFIEKKLSQNFSLKWDTLAIAIEQCKKADIDNRKNEKKSLENIQKKLRKEVIEIFEYADDKFDAPKKDRKKDEKFQHIKKSQAKDFLEKDLLPWMEINGTYSEDDFNKIRSFKGFTTILRGFMDNRANVYSEEAQITSLANRIVNENFEKFYLNICLLNKLGDKHISVISTAKNNTSYHREIFSLLDKIVFYNHCISPQEIKNYNEAIGEINKVLNEFNQKGLLDKKIKLKTLYKLQLCEGESSFKQVFTQYANDDELFSAVEKVYSEMLEGCEGNCFMKAIDFVHELSNVPKEKIFIEKKNLSKISNALYSNYSVLNDACVICCENGVGPVYGLKKKDAEKWLNKDLFSFAELESAVENSNIEEEFNMVVFSTHIENNLRELYENILEDSKIIAELRDSGWFIANRKNILSKKDEISRLKKFLDDILEFYHFVNDLYVGSENDRDEVLYEQLDESLAVLEYIIPLYNRVRNYVTQKPYSLEKFKLNFNIPELLNGWDKNKESSYLSFLLKRDEKYYLMIANKEAGNFKDIDLSMNRSVDNFQPGEDFYEKLEYKLLPGPEKMVPKVVFADSNKDIFLPSEDIIKIKESGSFKVSESNYSEEDCHRLIDFYKDAIPKYDSWRTFDFNFSDTSEYKNISEFFNEIKIQGYMTRFVKLPTSVIDQFVEDGKVYLFQIYNKDYAAGADGSKNLHTLYWEEVFSEYNLKTPNFWLNGGGEIFYRPASIDKPVKHLSGETLVNKTYVDDCGNRLSLPDDVYKQIKNYKNGNLEFADLSGEAKEYLNKYNIEFHEAKHEIIKDKRFTKAQYEFHIPITINAIAQGVNKRELNSSVLQFIKENPDVKILGIDRGERHLLYCTLIDTKGNILWQESFNIIDNGKSKIDYHSKLDNKEKERDKARKSWSSIGNIKDLKKGYLSQVVHKIAFMAVKHSAIIVMEDLNRGFKSSRSKIEKSVYQAFEKQLIDKLSYVAIKPNDEVGIYDDGGIAKGYQFVPPFESFQKLGKQHGIVFYVSPWNTSHVDPTTGFMNLFRFKSNLSGKDCKDFFNKMDSIKFNNNDGYFKFKFRYKNFDVKCEDYKNEWVVCSYGSKRYYNKKNQAGKWETEELNITERIADLLKNNDPKIEFDDGRELKEMIGRLSIDNVKSLYWLFRQLVALRYSKTGTTDDFILSPVKNKSGYFFNSDECKENGSSLPCDADANGAYHIALKGLQIRDDIKIDNSTGVFKLANNGKKENIKWVEYVQKRSS